MPRGKSQAEELVYEMLKSYISEKDIIRNTYKIIRSPITNCCLELDFYLPKYKLAIEVDGATHRTNCYGEERLKYQKRNDNIKEEECKKLGINLVRVPFGRDIKMFCDFAILEVNDLNNLLKTWE